MAFLGITIGHIKLGLKELNHYLHGINHKIGIINALLQIVYRFNKGLTSHIRHIFFKPGFNLQSVEIMESYCNIPYYLVFLSMSLKKQKIVNKVAEIKHLKK